MRKFLVLALILFSLALVFSQNTPCENCKRACDYIRDEDIKKRCHENCDKYVCENNDVKPQQESDNDFLPNEFKAIEPENDECEAEVNKARETFKELKTREEKMKYLKSVADKLKEAHPKAPDAVIKEFLRIVFFTPTPPKAVCELYKKWFKKSEAEKFVEPEPDCEKTVIQAREHFGNLTRREKEKFLVEVGLSLAKNYPNVERRKIAEFLRVAFFTRTPPKEVCELFKKIFKPDDEKEMLEQVNKALEMDEASINANVPKCIWNCLKGKVSIGDIIKAVFKCKKDLKCYVKELKLDEAALECISQCL